MAESSPENNNGMSVHYKKKTKSSGMRVHYENKRNYGVSIHRGKEQWGESSPKKKREGKRNG